MLFKAMLLWVVGLLTLVPYAGYQLFFEAAREQYALWITLILFWIIGYWGVAGPLIAALKVRAVLKFIEMARSGDQLLEALARPETRDAAIDLIAQENHLPRLLAQRVYDLAIRRLRERPAPAKGQKD